MVQNSFALILGLVILIIGAEGLVRGAASLAAKLRISPLVIGLTVVSFGTSAPELTVNLVAAMRGSSDLAVGNIIGSNIANILLILGISALVMPLAVKASTVWKEIPFALLGVSLLFIMGNDQLFDGVAFSALTRTDGIALLALMVIFMYYAFGSTKADRRQVAEATDSGDKIQQYRSAASVMLVLTGMAGLVLGGHLLVKGAVGIATVAGLSESLIGLTVVAIGTSLPELATSVVAALRRHADIAIGNVVGSNIFNVFFVLGTTSTILKLPITDAINFDMIVAVIVTLLLFLFMFVGGRHRLTRWQGGVFVGMYVVYLAAAINRG